MSDTGNSREVFILMRLWRRWFGGARADPRESIEDALDEAEGDEAHFSAREQDMLRNLLGFRDVGVEDVMVPRADIEALDKKSLGPEVLARFAACGHSRMPIFSGNLDRPLGMVHVKDVMSVVHKTGRVENLRLDALVRPILFVPPSMSALDLLLKMQATRQHMALVIDEYGGTDGLVTIENLIEEIVGEIEDEHDETETGGLHVLSGGGWRAAARLPLPQLTEPLGFELPDDDSLEDIDTLGGWVVALAGRVPERGEMIAHRLADGRRLEFIIRDGDPRRIKQIDLRLLPPAKQTKKI